jgi:hypothetical protein
MFKKMGFDQSTVIKFGLLGGLAEALYCLAVTGLISLMDNITRGIDFKILNFLLVLLLFVFSAGVSGILVFGYPAYLALQKRFIEAFLTAVISLLTLALVGLISFILLFFAVI